MDRPEILFYEKESTLFAIHEHDADMKVISVEIVHSRVALSWQMIMYSKSDNVDLGAHSHMRFLIMSLQRAHKESCHALASCRALHNLN